MLTCLNTVFVMAGTTPCPVISAAAIGLRMADSTSGLHALMEQVSITTASLPLSHMVKGGLADKI